MATNRRTGAGATLTLPVAVVAMLFASGAVLLANLAWYALVPLALVPLAVRLPAAERWPVWLQAVVVALYALAPVAGTWILASKPGLD
jgi:hypothetical protein